MDYMDKIVSQLETKEQVAVEQQPQPAVVDQQQPTNPEVQDVKVPEEQPSFDFDKEINDLLGMFEKDKPVERTVNDIVNQYDEATGNEKRLEKPQDFSKIVDELYEKFVEEQTTHKATQVEKTQLEQVLERERARGNELFDRVKEFEWELKKIKTKEYPEELQALIDYYKYLKEDNNNQYAKMHLVSEIAKIVEPHTNFSMTPYVNQWLGSGVLSETQGTQDIVPQQQQQNQGQNKGDMLANSFML